MNPLVLGEASLRLHAVPSRTLHCAEGYADPFDGVALVACERARGMGPAHPAVPDGNRAATLPDGVIEAHGRVWALGIKGIGAGGPLYGDGPLASLEGALVERPIVRESWMGESPFGAQGEPNAREGIARTNESVGARLFGMPICPVIGVVEIPEVLVEKGHHYRYFAGPIVSEHRLVPSNVRLFHGTGLPHGRGLGQAAPFHLERLGLHDRGRLHAFLETLLSTGLSALTLYAASLRPHPAGLEGLDFDDAWLDKDSLVAPDGALHFVDLESLDWVISQDEARAKARVQRQLARNAYDLLFAADALLRASELHHDMPRSDAARFAHLRELFLLGTAGHPRLALAQHRGDLLVHLLVPALGELVLPLLTTSTFGVR